MKQIKEILHILTEYKSKIWEGHTVSVLQSGWITLFLYPIIHWKQKEIQSELCDTKPHHSLGVQP
jgi:hypothetical protein